MTPDSGLPVRVLVNGLQLFYGRSLCRPGKSPQVVLKTNGFRYTKSLEYQYDESLVRAAERLHR